MTLELWLNEVTFARVGDRVRMNHDIGDVPEKHVCVCVCVCVCVYTSVHTTSYLFTGYFFFFFFLLDLMV